MTNYIDLERLTGLVIFELSGKEFCSDIRDISAIINPAELRKTSWLESQKNYSIKINNLSIPLINLYEIFGLKKIDGDGEKRILVMEVKNSMFGFYVEKVKEVLTSNKEFLQKINFIPYEGKANISGVLTYEGRKLFLPDFKKLLTQKELIHK